MSNNARRYNRNAQQAKQPKAKFEEQRQERSQHKLQPKTNKQKLYQHMLEQMTLVVAEGMAGTGKTMLPCYHAASLMLAKKIEKIVLIRPYTPLANKTIGFLPGTDEQKLMPYVLPMVGYLRDALGSATVDIMLADKRIEIQALESIRGRSFNDSYIICDEAQTAMVAEIQALTTRIGENCTLVITGDRRQNDLKKGENGISYLKRILDTYEIRDSGVIEFGVEDCVRSGICFDFLVAYENEGWV